MEKQDELLGSLNEIKKEITALRDKLNEVDQQKESWFQKKEECGKKIKDLIRQVKEKREGRDSLTKKVKENKEKRNELNKKIKDNISETKKLAAEKESLVKKHKIKFDPSNIKGEIDKLELKIETEVIPFEKEQGMVKRVKELKKKFDQVRVLNHITEKTNNLYKETSISRKEAETLHNTIQKNAGESQLIHEEIIKNSKEIDELKTKEDEAFTKFLEFKKNFNEINSILKDKLKIMGNINSEIQKIRHEKEEKIFKGKEEAVHEKIKRGQKLTTEDLLIFQKSEK